MGTFSIVRRGGAVLAAAVTATALLIGANVSAHTQVDQAGGTGGVKPARAAGQGGGSSLVVLAWTPSGGSKPTLR
jgi:hypothetical protein